MKKKVLLPAFFFVFALTSSTGHALKTGGHVRVSLLSEVKSIQPGTPFWVAVRLEMQPHWHTYWKNAGESGTPTEINWELPAGFQPGPIVWPAPQKIAIPPVVSYGFEEEALLLTSITPPSVFRDSHPVSIKAHVDWLECESVCIPGHADIALTLPLTITPPEPNLEWQEKFSAARFAWPLDSSDWTVHAYKTAKGFQLAVSNPKEPSDKPSQLTFFAEDPTVIDYGADQNLRQIGGATTLDLFKSDASTSTVTRLRGVLFTPGGWRGPGSEKALAIDAPIEGKAPSPGGRSLLAALALAFVGGLILNLMPCVLPVLSIKILGFIKQAGESPRAIFLHGAAFSSGVIVSFWALAGTLLFLRAGGEELGWGFQLQSPAFIIGLAILFFILALNLFGFFEIGTSFIRLAGLSQGKSGYAGSFLSGVLATLVATPCTAPFMGSALGFALTQPAWAALLIFTSLGAGMASPYMVLSANPRFLKFVPKPGPWMETLKKIMGLLFLATVAWLLWVLSQQLSARAGSMPAPAGAVEKMKSEPYSAARVEELREQGRIVFVDFTAAWCLTCQVNERVVLNSKSVTEGFRQKNVFILKADWTSHDAKIAEALEEFGRSGVPFYILYPANPQAKPIPLPEILTKQIVLDALNKV